MMLNHTLSLILLACLALAGCVEAIDQVPEQTDGKPEVTVDDEGKEDRWNSINDPTRFSAVENFEFTLTELPLQARADGEAWPSTYFPTYQDSIQVRWKGLGEHSAAELYDEAFNGWTPPAGFDAMRPFRAGQTCDTDDWDSEYYENLGPLANLVSSSMGNKDARDGVDNDCDGEVDECDDHDGVQTWFGLCHAWVPAAILEPRPMGPVTYEGVTFDVGDMEGLLMLAYNRSSANMIGGRCNLFSSREDMARARGCRLPEVDANAGDNRRECSEYELNSYVIERDEHGAAVQNQCDDTNPGSFHVTALNYLMNGRAFAYDQTYDYQVWNQPVVAFEVTKLEEITPTRANELLEEEGDQYLHNDDAAKLYEVHAISRYITESYASRTPAEASRYERTNRHYYILEVDSAGEIIGGEWFGQSHEDHPDFLWDPMERTSSSVSHLDLDNVRMLVQLSRQPEVPVDGDVVTITGTGGLSIPDNNPQGVSTSVNVPDSITIAGLQLELDLSHTYIGDLIITLSHDGIDRVVHNRTGGSDNDIRTTLNVPGFNGVDAQGQWTIHISDHAGQDVGTLQSWKLHITPGTGGDTGGSTGGDTVNATASNTVSIPDNNATGASSTINVTDSLTLGSVDVHVKITHTYIGDLKVTLSHGGVTEVLHDRSGGGTDNIDKVITVTGFNGMDATGAWTLHVTDSANIDTGNIGLWSLALSGESSGGTTDPGTDEPQLYPGEGGISIPDNNAAGITSEAAVPSGISGTVNVQVNVTHTWRGDLIVTLSHSGQTWTLHNRDGGSADDLSASYPLSPAPTGSLAGVWTLKVSDNAGADLGTLDSWSIAITP